MNDKNNKKTQRAQTAVELAVFGTVLIFLLGIIIRSALGRGHQQHAILKANRMAMTWSYNTSSSMWNASRNTASVLVVEDRLTAASAKYGAVDRIPLMMQGSGTHSANLFMPVDFEHSEDLPVMDVFVNGKHFVFSTSAFETYNAAGLEEEADCTEAGLSCPKLYTIIDNHELIDRWCDDESDRPPCPVACSADPANPVLGCNLSADERFDLDRTTGSITVPAGQRARFAWQWYLVMGFDEERGAAGLQKAEGINVKAGKNVDLDVDADLKLERVVSVTSGADGVISEFRVKDFQNGDIDYTHNDSDPGLVPGFTEDVRMYSFVRGGGATGGTYLQIDEGNLFAGSGDSKQFIRTASKKDSIDIIERFFQLSNNTGRLCQGSTPIPPVEVCASSAIGCYSTDNIDQTCFNTANNLLYIRSRVSDVHGRKWVTDVTDDPTVDWGGTPAGGP